MKKIYFLFASELPEDHYVISVQAYMLYKVDLDLLGMPFILMQMKINSQMISRRKNLFI